MPGSMKRRVAIFLVLLLAFFLSQFFRHANAVIAPDLASDLSLNAQQLGLMTSLFYAAFAAAQLPVGAGLDRRGPRVVTPLVMLAAAPGALLFASATGFPVLATGRALIGFGMSAVLMGAYMALALWFPPQRFATLASLLVGLGSMGGMAAAAPLAWLNDRFGWRAVFMAASLLVVLSAALIFLVVRDPSSIVAPSVRAEEIAEEVPETTLPDDCSAARPGLSMIFRCNAYWRIAAMYFWMPGMLLAAQGLWAGPLLYDVFDYPSLRVGSVLTLISLGTIVGNLVGGSLSDRFGPGRITLGAACISLLSQLGIIVAVAWLVPQVVPVAYFGLGFGAGFNVLLLIHARTLLPPTLTGRVVTGVNMFGFIGAAGLQWTLGLLIGSFGRDTGGHYPPAAYATAFGVTAAGLLLAAAWYAPLALMSRSTQA